jgi:hypothetical protein
MLRFPHLGPREPRSPASSVLSEHYDFLCRIRSRLCFSLLRSNRSSPGSLPCGGELRSGLVPFKPGTAGYSSAGQSQDLPGSWGIRPVPLPRSRIPASSSALAFSARRCSPHFADNEDTSTTDISRLNHAASVPAAYASSGALPHPHARLASGRWLTFAGWDSNPLDSIEKFSSSTSDFLLSQIYPGATAKLPQSPGHQGRSEVKSRLTR